MQTYGRDEPWPTFHEACIAKGLLEDDGEWRQCLEEASTMQTGQCLCQLFATLLMFCNPTYPEQLWETFRQHICDDLHYCLHVLGIENPTEDQVHI